MDAGHFHRDFPSSDKWIQPSIETLRRREEMHATSRGNAWKEEDRKCRRILFDWMLEVSAQFHMRRKTVHNAMRCVDRFVRASSVDSKWLVRKRLQVVGIGALLVSAKFEEVYVPTNADFLHISDNAFTMTDLSEVEMHMMDLLEWDCDTPTVVEWTELLLCASNEPLVGSASKQDFLDLMSLVDLCMLSWRFSGFSMSVLAVSAISVVCPDRLGALLSLSAASETHVRECVWLMSQLNRGTGVELVVSAHMTKYLIHPDAVHTVQSFDKTTIATVDAFERRCVRRAGPPSKYAKSLQKTRWANAQLTAWLLAKGPVTPVGPDDCHGLPPGKIHSTETETPVDKVLVARRGKRKSREITLTPARRKRRKIPLGVDAEAAVQILDVRPTEKSSLQSRGCLEAKNWSVLNCSTACSAWQDAACVDEQLADHTSLLPQWTPVGH